MECFIYHISWQSEKSTIQEIQQSKKSNQNFQVSLRSLRHKFITAERRAFLERQIQRRERQNARHERQKERRERHKRHKLRPWAKFYKVSAKLQ